MYKFPKEEKIEYQLQKPFSENEIEWRPQSAGISNNGKPWVLCLAYVQARAIQCRLDEVFGFDGWETEYRDESSGIMCKLSVYKGDKKVSKEDGAPETNIDAFKGGISGAFKRVSASGYGIGRYLYCLEVSYASKCSLSPEKGYKFHKGKNGEKNIWWSPPKLPNWALPIDEQLEGGDIAKPKQKYPFNCVDCGYGITDGIKQYSVSVFKKPLCPNCQKKVKAGPYAGAIKTLEEVST